MNLKNANNSAGPIRVMIVDDSALMRKLLSEVLARDPGIEVIDTAMDGQFALDHLARVKPDVILMDVDMPRLDGLSALDRIVADYGLPVVMCSTRTTAGAEATLEALRRGAVDFIEKPALEALTSGEATAAITSRVRGAMGARVRAAHRKPAAAPPPISPRRPIHAATGPLAPSPSPAPASTYAGLNQVPYLARKAMPELIAIGTSTGGPPALELILAPLSANYPLGLVIVQHMPAGFTNLLAAHLDRNCQIAVREAVEGERVLPGVALIAPGGAHLRVVRAREGYAVALDDRSPTVSGHRPSVDVLFDSVAQATHGRAAAVIMTGMGSDGAEGMGRLAAVGAVTIAQTPDSCICFGMPKSAIDRGYARAVVSLDEITTAIMACTTSAVS